MKKGDLVKCECDECAKDPEAGWFKAHKSHGHWVKFIHRHHCNTQEGRERARKLGLQYSSSLLDYVRSDLGRETSRKNIVKVRNQLLEYIHSDEGRATSSRNGQLFGAANLITYVTSDDNKNRMSELGRKLTSLKLKDRSKCESLIFPILKQIDAGTLWNEKTFPVGSGSKGGHYTLDFFLPKYNVALELDGDGHRHRIKHDAKRDAELLRQGIRTIRIKNKDAANLTKRRLIWILLQA